MLKVVIYFFKQKDGKKNDIIWYWCAVPDTESCLLGWKIFTQATSTADSQLTKKKSHKNCQLGSLSVNVNVKYVLIVSHSLCKETQQLITYVGCSKSDASYFVLWKLQRI